MGDLPRQDTDSRIGTAPGPGKRAGRDNGESSMVERSASGKGSSRRPGNRAGDWIWGRRVVVETLRAGRWPIRDLWLADRVEVGEVAEVKRLAEPLGIDVQIAGSDALRQRCHTSEHQGYLARVGLFPFENLETLMETSSTSSLWLLLDSVQDPHNLGGILRAAEVFGVDGVVVSGRNHAPVNGHVARSSAGAVNHVRIARSDNLVSLVMQLRRQGVKVVAAMADDPVAARTQDLVGSTALVVGNEGHGVEDDVLAVCDGKIGIEQAGHTESLNVAVATGVLLYEVDRQRREQESRS